MKTHLEVVGLIPAAGHATRGGRLPCSKELYPIGFMSIKGQPDLQPKVACHYPLEAMRRGGIKKVYVVLREGKWDIPSYLGDGKAFDLDIAYLMRGLPFGVPFTLEQAFPFIERNLVALGWPDILFHGVDGYQQLLDRQRASGADIVLGLFPADRPQKVDMVDLDESGQLREIVIKPSRTHLQYTWGMAVWTPVFSHFMHEFVLSSIERASTNLEISVGDVIQAAYRKGLSVDCVHISDKPYVDIGTPDDLQRAVKCFGGNNSLFS